VCGTVGAAIETANGDLFVGVCVDTASSRRICAGHSAAAAMLPAGQSKIVPMVAVDRDDAVLPPCGRCGEFIVATVSSIATSIKPTTVFPR
jgi:cytidine deaminase